MTMIQKTTAAFAALALMAGASAASAQSYKFNQSAGASVQAEGTLIQNVAFPGVEETTCHVTLHGAVTNNGDSITFTSYEGEWVSGGDLACDESLDFPIVVTAFDATTINLDQFVVGTRSLPCQEDDFKMRYVSNDAYFDARTFGIGGLCYADGSLAVTSNGNDVLIVAK